MARTKGPKRPTDTKLVLDALIGRDDFMNRAQLAEATGIPTKGGRLSMALTHLLHYKAAEAVDVGGTLWFMATPGYDTRIRTIAEIKDGITRKRKPRAKTEEPKP